MLPGEGTTQALPPFVRLRRTWSTGHWRVLVRDIVRNVCRSGTAVPSGVNEAVIVRQAQGPYRKPPVWFAERAFNFNFGDRGRRVKTVLPLPSVGGT